MKKDSILIVDDEYINQYVLKEILTEYELVFAQNCVEMNTILKDSPPDLILLDIMLPDKDGITIARELQQNDFFSSIPIIFLSAKIDSEDIKTGFESGAYDYITKPFDETILKTRIKAALSKSSHEKEYVMRYLISEERYKNLFEQSNDAIFIHTYQGDILDVNERASQLLTVEKKDILKKNICSLFDPSETENGKKLYETTVRKGSLQFQSLFRRPDNYLIDIDVSARIVDRENQIIQSIVRDITPQKEYENNLKAAKETAERANRTKDIFLANISHELRTPLNGILGFAEILCERLDTLEPEEQKEYVQIITDSGRHLLDIVNDLLDLTLIEANQINLSMSTFDLNSMLHSAVQLVKESAREKNISITEDFQNNPGTFTGDERRLKQVVLNLLSNAVKYTGPNKKIGLLVKEGENNQIKITVWDEGKGIPDDKFHDIFLPFEQLKKNYTDISGGIGIGLTLVKRIVDLHGGKISVKSRINEGTSFTIHLDGYVSSAITDNPIDTETEKEKEERVLIVDDDTITTTLISKILTMNTIQYACCESGEEALYELSENSYSVILMDIQLSGLDGILTMKAIKSQYEVPIIAQTAYAMKGDKEKLLEEGFDDYIAKPITEKGLLETLAKYVRVPGQE